MTANQNIFVFIVIITIAMFSAGLASAIKYSASKNISKTYNQNCLEQFNYTCGFCPESKGDYYSCENNLFVKNDGPNETYFILAMCLLLVNPFTFFCVFVIFELIYKVIKLKVMTNPRKTRLITV